MNFTLLSSIFTVISLAAFVGIWLWAYSRTNRTRFEEMGRLPLIDDEDEVRNARSNASRNPNEARK